MGPTVRTRLGGRAAGMRRRWWDPQTRRLGLGSETGRGAFRVVGSFTPAPASAFVAVEKAADEAGSASDVEAAKERVGWGDGPSGERGERGELGADAVASEGGRVRVRRGGESRDIACPILFIFCHNMYQSENCPDATKPKPERVARIWTTRSATRARMCHPRGQNPYPRWSLARIASRCASCGARCP